MWGYNQMSFYFSCFFSLLKLVECVAVLGLIWTCGSTIKTPKSPKETNTHRAKRPCRGSAKSMKKKKTRRVGYSPAIASFGEKTGLGIQILTQNEQGKKQNNKQKRRVEKKIENEIETKTDTWHLTSTRSQIVCDANRPQYCYPQQ